MYAMDKYVRQLLGIQAECINLLSACENDTFLSDEQRQVVDKSIRSIHLKAMEASLSLKAYEVYHNH